MTPGADYYRHGLRRMTGRDVGERHRSANILELFFDLTFVTAFSVAGTALAHGFVEGHVLSASVAFAIAMLAIVWAWTGYTWFASAFDNDDWLFRVLTLVQMTGVVVVAIGIPEMFASVEEGEHFTGGVMVAGYVVMRVAVIGQWLRVAADDRRHRSLAVANVVTVGIAQCGWVAFILLPLSLPAALAFISVFWILDLAGPIAAERIGARRGDGGSPWHPHHIAERYGLLAIIAIGETISGTLASADLISAARGWTVDSVVVIGAGILTSFALWWTYFLLPSGPVLAAQRWKVAPWAYAHIVLFAAITAVGAGLHVLGYVFDSHHHVGTLLAILSVSVPVLVFMTVTFAVHAWLVGSISRNPAHVLAFGAPVLAPILAAAGTPSWACLLVVLASPVSIIVCYELGDWRSLAAQLDRALASASGGTRGV